MALHRRLFGRVGLGGCGGGLILVAIIVLFVAGLLFVINTAFRSSPVYTQAMDAARTDSRVVQALGTPIEAGWFIMGSLSEQGMSGDADLAIPIAGPRKGGTLYASARKGNGRWQFYTLAVRIDGQNELLVLEY